MLSHKVLTRQNVGRAASYYEDAADDYYAKEGEATAWQGRAAEALGLSGAVDSERFRELLAGKIADGVRISRASTRQDSKTRIGIDLTFSAPKSVSLQALVHGDAAIIQAHDAAVQRTIAAAEERAQARKKVNGKSQLETTANLVVAKFRHETSREQDPQLHTHALVMNLTQRRDGQWRALKNDEIVKATRYLGAVYNAELASELQRLGHPLRFGRDGNFELAHMTREQLEGFSQRGAQVEERLAAQGLTRATATATAKQQAALQSRERKVAVDRQALQSAWQDRAQALGIEFGKKEWARDSGPAAQGHQPAFLPAGEAAKRAVRYALNHLSERQSIVNERELIDTALKHGVGSVRLADIQAEIANQSDQGYLIREAPHYRPATEQGPGGGPALTRAGWIAGLVEQGLARGAAKARVDTAIALGGLVAGERRYTTQTALGREKRILQIEREGRGQLAPLMSREAAHERLRETALNTGQRAAAALMVSSTDRLIGVQGFAGTGKSHLLDTAKALIEGQGFEVRALAPYGSQVKALRKLNVQANTLASFLRAKDQTIDARTVLVIDEAGVVPSRLMERALKLAERAGARVVLMGDTAQTKAIEAGRPFDQLQAAGMRTAHLEEIQRQQDPELKRAVELAAQGHTASSLQRIKAIIEIKDAAQRHRTVAEDYVKLSAEDRERTLIVSGTNAARRAISATVREGLGTAGQGIAFDTLIRRDTTQAERRYAKHYHIGDRVQPEKDYRNGLKRAELYRVEDTGPGNRLTVRSEQDGQRIEFSPATHRKLSVYAPERTELAPGDRVRITRNDPDRDLANGDRFTVARVEAGRLTLTDGSREVELTTERPLHLDHAYATTVHSSQGLTADRVLIDADARSRTSAKDVYYVAISRARYEARIYTDDRARLPPAMARDNIKHAALDLVRERRPALERESVNTRRREPGPHQEHAAGDRPRTLQSERARTQGRQKGDS